MMVVVKWYMASQVTANRVVLTSLLVDILDIFLNIAATIVTGSVVMIAELFQAISDLIASLLLFVGLKRPKKEIYLWTILSALVMLFVASSLSFYFGLKRFLHPEPIENIFIAYIMLLVGAISNAYALFISVKRLLQGKHFSKLMGEFNNSPLVMTKNTLVLDLMGMSSALTGLTALVLYQFFGDMRFDGLGAMSIGVILAFLSTNLILGLKVLLRRKNITREV